MLAAHLKGLSTAQTVLDEHGGGAAERVRENFHEEYQFLGCTWLAAFSIEGDKAKRRHREEGIMLMNEERETREMNEEQQAAD